MIECIVETTLHAPIDKLWALCEDFGNLDWFKGHGIPGADKVEVEGEGVGMARFVHMPGFSSPIKEVLTAINTEQKTFSYEIPAHDLMPFTDYVVDASLTENSENITNVRWVARFNTEVMSEADAIGIMQDTYSKMLLCLQDAANA